MTVALVLASMHLSLEVVIPTKMILIIIRIALYEFERLRGEGSSNSYLGKSRNNKRQSLVVQCIGVGQTFESVRARRMREWIQSKGQ